MSDAPMLRPRVLIPFTIATIIWGTTWIVIRDQLGTVPPTWSVAYRFAAAAAAMFVYAAFTKSPFRIGRQGQMFAAVFGFAQFVLNFNFVYRAEAFITSGLVAVLFALLLVPNALLGRAFLKQPLSGRFLLGSIVAVIGVGMLIAQEVRADSASASATIFGVSFTLLGVLSASVANIMQGTARGKALPMASTLAWGMLWGTAMNAVFAFWLTGTPVIEWTPSYIGGVIYLGVFASAIAFTCYFSVIRDVGPARAAYSSVLTPILAMIISTVVEDYRWSWLAASGGVVALAGLLIALSARRPVAKSG
jgi:drug/metabolite transporter (DMT)-like permease